MTRAGGSVGIGARLRAARERKGLTVLQAAEKLHVDAKVLESLEAEDFAPLGADVYVRGHLRRYAELVGESAGELQDLYASAGLAVHPDLTRIPRVERPSESSHLRVAGTADGRGTRTGRRAVVGVHAAGRQAADAGAAATGGGGARRLRAPRRPADTPGRRPRRPRRGRRARAAAPPAPGRPSA